jgi:hypothetical protein
LKPVAWRKKIARILLRTSLPSKIVSRSIKLNSLVLENPNEVEQILAHRIGCQRATASLSCRVATSNQVRIPNLQEKSTHGYGCFKDFLTKSRAAHVSPCCVVGCAEQ